MVLFCTDSSAALDLIHKTLGANSVSQFSHLEHLDLLLPIWETRNNHSCTLQKIKAHLEAASFSDPIDAYECFGNKFANDIAQQVNTVFCLSMVSELEALQVLPLMLALTDARQKLPIDKTPSQDTGVTVDRGSQSLMWTGLSQHR